MCQVAWRFGKTPRDRQIRVIILIIKKGNLKQCTNQGGISLFKLPRKAYTKRLERKCREIVESKLEDGQYGFRPITAPKTKSSFWNKSSRNKLWDTFREYGTDGRLLRAIKSFYYRPEVCVRVNGKQSKPFHVSIGFWQVRVLSPHLFMVYMNWIDKCSQADKLWAIRSSPDNLLAPASLLPYCEWRTLPELASDDLPIEIVLPLSPVRHPNTRPLKFNCKKARWDVYQSLMLSISPLLMLTQSTSTRLPAPFPAF